MSMDYWHVLILTDLADLLHNIFYYIMQIGTKLDSKEIRKIHFNGHVFRHGHIVHAENSS